MARAIRRVGSGRWHGVPIIPACLAGLGLLLAGMGCGDSGNKRTPTEPPNAQASPFADPHLEAAVRAGLVDTAGPLSQEWLLALTQLTAQSRGIADLHGIDLLGNLQRLDLADNRIQDLVPLARMVQLTYLDLSYNQVQDLTVVAALTELDTLVLDYNPVQNLSPLAALSRLRRLGLVGAPLSEASRIAQVPALQARGVRVDIAPSEAEARAILFQRGEEAPFVYSIHPDGSALIAVAQGNHPVRSPDGELVLINDLRGRIRIMSPDGRVLGAMEGGSHYNWSPGGESIAFQRGGSVLVVARDGSGERLLASDRCSAPFWSPVDALTVYYNRTHPTSMDATDLFTVNVATGESRRVRELTYIPDGLTYPFSPDGTRVFVSECGREGIWAMSLATGELTQMGPAGERVGAQRPAWSPDGKRIVFEVGDGILGLYVADSEGESVRTLVPGRTEAAPGGGVWSPTGDRIAFHIRDWTGNQPTCIYLINADGTRMRRLTEGEWPVW